MRPWVHRTAVVLACAALVLLGIRLLAPAKRDAPPPTFNRDVAPILFEHCASCHRPGGAGPFSLLDHDAARRRAKQIVEVTSSGYMPPWLPEPGYGRFSGERGLSDAEIETLRRWAAGGRERGADADLPPVPSWPDGWSLGTPDLELSLAEPYTLPAAGRDVYRNFVIRSPVERARWVRALELRPSDPRLVHHARIVVDPSPLSRHSDERDPAPGFDGMDLGSAVDPDGFLLGWAPGRSPDPGRDGMSWALRPGTDIVIQLHMVPSGKPETIDVRLGLYFAAAPPTLLSFSLVLGSREIDIPPGATDHEASDDYELPVAVEAIAILPHAHYLGKRMHVTATPPDGSRRWLLRIDGWDFNWQDLYRYAEPVPLPAGTRIAMRYGYDNSADNPFNPHSPPRRVRYGPQTTDEMAELVLQVVPQDPDDLAVLEADYRRRHVLDAIDYRRRQLRDDPADADAHGALGAGYLELGRYEEAAAALGRAVQLRPDAVRFRNNLGYALERLGRTDEALGHYRHAAARDPGLAEVQSNLGRALRSRGRWTEALPHLDRAAQLQPELPAPLVDLAWVLATHPDPERRDPERAVRLAERAAALTERGDPVALATLAAALAADGRFEDAVAEARRALELAGDEDFAATVRGHLAAYEGRRAVAQDGVR